MPPKSGVPNPDPVVSNTTPLITLAGVGLLDLLCALYGETLIPDVVYEEYQTGRSRHPAGANLDGLSWISVQRVAVDPDVSALLDAGEAATISLARACHARLVLLDERRGRREAARLGLPVAGSLAVLVAAKERGLLPAVRRILDQIIAQGRRISPGLRERILSLVGENIR